MNVVPWVDVAMHRTTSSQAATSSQADGRSEQSRRRQVTMVGHSDPEQSALHLHERLGETRQQFMGLLTVKLHSRPIHSPSR